MTGELGRYPHIAAGSQSAGDRMADAPVDSDVTCLRGEMLPGDEAQAMGQWEHGGGFSVDG